MIKHFPIIDTEKVIQHYSEKDGVLITYVCTTELNQSNLPVDIFYRSTPHPKFGNRYFGIYARYDAVSEESITYICNADNVERMVFGMVEDDDKNLQYSQYRHDYKSFNNGNNIDGGRAYTKSSGEVVYYIVKNGAFVQGKIL